MAQQTVQNSTRPNPTNIANANPNPPTPADRVVPVHSWRLVIVPCPGVWLRDRSAAELSCVNLVYGSRSGQNEDAAGEYPGVFIGNVFGGRF